MSDCKHEKQFQTSGGQTTICEDCKQVLVKGEPCYHEEQVHMPDSLADVCKNCGQVFIDGEVWAYKSGNLMDWVNDFVEAKKDA